MIKSVCGYCGVGCGIEYDEQKLLGDLSYPVNEGLVCPKGVSELQSILTPTRLLRPKYRRNIRAPFEEMEWEQLLPLIAHKIQQSDPSRIGFYLSGQLLTEDYYIANKLAKGFIGTNHVDTNSRTCMSSAVEAYKKAFGVDYVPVRMDDIDYTDLLILAGSNIAEAHVVLFNKVKRLKKQGLKIIVIDPRKTETAKHADLHLAIRPGSDIDFFNLVARRLIDEDKIDHEFIQQHTNESESFIKEIKKQPKTKLLKRTGLSKKEFDAFMELFYENENIITAWTMGLNQSAQGVDKNLSVINMHLLSGKICKTGNGPFSLTGQPNAMGGREVGGLATTLAVHLDYTKESIEKVGTFWQTDKLPNKHGLTACEMVEAALDKKLDVLIICHTDPVYHLPNRKKTELAFKNIPFIVEINAYKKSETSNFAHVQLPASPWGEKEGTQTNLDRTITRQERLTRRSIDCKDDWEIFMLLAHELGYKNAFDYSCAQDIFNEYKNMTRLSTQGHLNIYECDYEALKTKPFIWGENLFKEKQFFTENKKANFHFVSFKNRSERTTIDYPFLLLTGRTRDQWHSGTKTSFVKNLMRHKPLNFVEIHPSDAETLGIQDGESVTVSSQRGSITSYAKITDEILEKTLFIPVSHRGINYLTDDKLDPDSKEPDYNHSAVAVRRC
jgi:anaerobic selenocysteine-containing dehydrogenase